MSTKVKLRYALICMILIPIIVINVFVSFRLNEYNDETFHTKVEALTRAWTDRMGDSFEGLFAQAKEVASLEHIREFAVISNKGEFVDGLDSESFEEKLPEGYEEYGLRAMEELERIRSYSSIAEETMIINNAGIVTASTKKNYIGKSFNGVGKISFEDICEQYVNGVTPMFLEENGYNSMPMFYLCRNIYSANNQLQGIYLQLCNTQFLQDVIDSAKNVIYQSASLMVVDSRGNLLEYPYYTVNSYENVLMYQPIQGYIERSISANENISQSVFDSYVNNGSTILIYNKSIPHLNWSVIFSVNKQDVAEILKTNILGIRLISLYMSIVFLAVSIFLVVAFTKPIENIMDVLEKKQRGDQQARFKITASDEFGQIGEAFNSMFDDVFESEQRYRTIVEMTDNVVFEINFRKNVVFISNNFNQKYSFRPKTDKLQDSFFYRGRIHKDDKERFNKDFEKLLDRSDYLQGEYRFKNIYGDFAWVLIRATKFYDREHEPTKVVGVIVDIDREKKSEMHLVQKASYDALTQLYNRDTFIKSLANEFELARMRKTLDAVLFIDLDDFKFFNDQYGHACGDEVLKFCADSLKEIVFDKGFAGRFGGDEFVVCLNNQQYFGDPGIVAQEIITAFNRGFISESTEKKLSVNCSIGIAFFGENGKSCEEILSAADEAMYRIKKHGKSNYGYVSAKKLSAENAQMINNMKNN